MNRISTATLLAASLAATLSGCAGMPQSVPAWGSDLVAVTQSNKLVSFNHKSPGTYDSSYAISGLAADEVVVAIDYRPSDGKLYGLGSGGHLYVLDINGGKATLKSTLAASSGDTFTALAGKVYDIDFNPASGQLSVVSDSGQNLLVDADSGAVASGTPFPGKSAIVAAAYTTVPNGPFKATLYVINAKGAEIDSVIAPASGTLTTVGAIGSDIGNYAGFDIAGNESTGVAYAALSTPDTTSSKLYMVKLNAGSAKSQGTIGEGKEKIRSLAIRGSVES